MSDWPSVLNAAAVGVFGAVLSAAFCDIKWTRGNRWTFWGVLVLLGALQAVLFAAYSAETIRRLYPLITHLPLVLLLWGLSGRRLWSIIAVLTAYLCCQFRRWLALFCAAVFSGGEVMQCWVEIAVTVPLLLAIIKMVGGLMRGMSRYPLSMQLQLGLIPAIAYVFDYLTRIYTNWLAEGVPAAVEFMPFVCSAAYFFFAMHSVDFLRKRSELEQVQAGLDLQVQQSARQIASLRQSQEQAAAYRHDLRHHLQYISVCIENNALEQAQDYIRSLNDQVTRQTVTQYCENSVANLILSAFSDRAEEAGVEMEIHVRLGEQERISDNDLSVLLSNALENALNACARVRAEGRRPVIELRGYEKKDRVFLELVNSCCETVEFRDGLPVARKEGHGIGARSIVAVVEKYGGIYVFEQQEDRFVFRASL